MRKRISCSYAKADSLTDILYDETLTTKEQDYRIEGTVEWMHAKMAELQRLTGYTGIKK